MRDGFIRTAAATPKIKVADTVHNRETICRIIEEYEKKGAELLVFPELCLSGYTCNDLFQQEILLEQVKEELKNLVDFTKGRKMLLFAGLPWEHEGKLYNVAAAICDGELLGLVTKTNMPNYSEFYELRHFTPGMEIPVLTDWLDTRVPMGTNLLFTCKENPKLTVAAEICEDVWVPCPPSIRHALAGATVIVNCSASDEVVGKDSYRRELICGQSARLITASSGYDHFGSLQIYNGLCCLLDSSQKSGADLLCRDMIILANHNSLVCCRCTLFKYTWTYRTNLRSSIRAYNCCHQISAKGRSCPFHDSGFFVDCKAGTVCSQTAL